ncbi:TPA: ketoacyl-ACP synthase III [Bacillus anthracis]|uniref:ketoacyl-ACP synthase III n=1 Tax=Bacillus anthracis TaxID=1392 RepID=UPI0001DBF64F|nr:ketoacyl-ACP synthase III [Bacillus cereus]HDR4494494.1 ketoacyl-ACP synthase III [Bacillus cereus biovar anthracis]ADK04476.1 3-oxoacyl-(acyl carrier protein) synthase [Bacillus cereus biovar anthracis str. CI]HDR6226477.1 ketoacyl-ACP synthase III [Bacillus cereus biovar anthracis]HDR6232243.1 ketoacyl-ACP synthase III [Bacillus cereus biovar anthracis]HDR6237298.1 ketoacyl-ACP synthase III [Bacillus cereus biovar anthracis]
MNSKSRITAIGTHVPNQILSNHDLEKMIDTNDEWIVQRTGMKERRIASEEEYSSHLAIKAIENLCTTFKKSLEDIDCIIVATTTADFVFPSVACQIQQHFNIPHTMAFDLNATCAGFTYGLHVGNSLITSGSHKKVLVVATETLSKVTDYTDRTTCILFGDGAGAILLERDENNPSFIAYHMGTNGHGGIHLYRTNLSTTMNDTPLQTNEKIVQNGREVYKWATRTVPVGIKELLHTANMKMDDIDWFIPHSANLRMIESICEKSQIPIQKTLTSVEYMGNTSSVSIPLALNSARKESKLNNGDKLLLYGFGGGLTHLGLIVEWDLS